ncbi:MAG: glutamate-5-semialdehyde dehydrogenase [Bacteroidota bacterium]|nr:glutamate-5-semialdehyde dehydrogenase [Bacteroidota bacterium]
MNTTESILISAKKATQSAALLSEKQINQLIDRIAIAAISNMQFIIDENKKDLALMDPLDPRYDRLKLTPNRIRDIASDLQSVATLPTPLNRIHSDVFRPNGLHIRKISVPFGVIGVIYEARPNVTFDVSGLCLKSGNVCVLKGGSDAEYSNRAIVSIIRQVLEQYQTDPNLVNLLPSDREATAQLLNARDYVDLLIPRGGQSLIDFVRKNATIPVIETGAGICHTYFDESGNKTIGQAIITNAKTRRVSVCNALDILIIHHSRLNDLPFLCEKLAASNVEIFADTPSFNALAGYYPESLLREAAAESYSTEFLAYKMAIKTVGDMNEALNHISLYGSKHSEAIITEDADAADLFQKRVDAAVVYVNTSTAFTDGAQFGLGAEIGISTQKLHARGPMGLEELTSYKWLVESDGCIRKP